VRRRLGVAAGVRTCPPCPHAAPSERCQRCAAPTSDANALHGGLVHQLRVPQTRPAGPGSRRMPGRARSAAPAQWVAPMVGGSDCGWQQATGRHGSQSRHSGEREAVSGWCLVRPCPLAASGWRWLESKPARTTPTGQGVHQGGQRRLAGGAAEAAGLWKVTDSVLCFIMAVKMGGRTVHVSPPASLYNVG